MSAEPLSLVTGGTGFLGRHLVEELLSRGERLRILTTGIAPDWLMHADVELVGGSLTEPEVAERAVAGVQRVYHLAGRVSRNREDARAMYAVHVDGTRHLCEAARAEGVGRIVLASTSGTVAVAADDTPRDESAPSPLAVIARWPYYASKHYQEQTALAICAAGGPELCILNPSLLLGPGDDRLSSTEDVLKFLRRDIPVVPSGGINFVDVRDVAQAFVAAMERGRPGERYLLGGPNWRFSEFFGRLERLTKIAGPRLRAPDRLAVFGSKLLDGVFRRLDRVSPIDPVSVEMAGYYWYVDDSKARSELGFSSRDPGDTLYDTVQYLREHLLGREAFSA